MNEAAYRFISVDLMPVLAAVLAAVSCGILGNFLVLRKLSLMGDAISHSVLPGLVIAFLIASSRSPGAMFLGAAAAGIATVMIVELVKRVGRVDPGAAMGVVFSVLFALGVLLLERAAARQVDLDADCVLYGQLETLFWVPPPEWSEFFSFATAAQVPPGVWSLIIVAIASCVFVAVLFKELRIAAFDAELSTTLGFSAGLLHVVLMVVVAAATVAAFEAVGSILVVAMLVCPAATARLVTDRLGSQIVVSVVVALISAVGGYIGATAVPAMFGADAVNAAGAIAVASGVMVAAAALGSPSHGVIARWVSHRRLGMSTAADDYLAGVYRAMELGVAAPHRSGGVGERVCAARGLVDRGPDGALRLTDRGLERAREIVRRHRQWESYLVDEAGFAPDHVHPTAERLEHLGIAPEIEAARDPHGREIPPPGGR